MLHGRVSANDFQFIVDKVRHRLSGWNAKLLTTAARVTLAKAVLVAIPNYCMQIGMVPVSICKEIERLVRRFIWGGSDEQRKTSLVGWKSVCQPLTSGGLGLRRLKRNNEAFMIKLGFNLVAKKNEFWVRILREKYKVGVGCPSSISRPGSSFIWRSLMKVWEKIYDSVCWSLGDGKRTKFWLDIWCPQLGPLIRHKIDNSVVDLECLACEMVDGHGEWKWGAFRHFISSEAAAVIAGIRPPYEEVGADICIWRWEKNGKLSLASAYESICKPSWDNMDKSWALAWNYKGPQRIRHFLWLVLQKSLMTNVERCRRHCSNDVACIACGAAQENLNHILRGCPNAVKVWESIVPRGKLNQFFTMNLDNWLMDNLNCNDITGEICWSTIFGMICWRLWKNRNQLVFQGEIVSSYATIAQCRAWARSVHGNELKLAKSINKVLKQVQWHAPPDGFCKLNCDGAVKYDSERAASGGVLRDSAGEWVLGYTRHLGTCSVVQTELWAVYDGLKLAWQRGIRNILVESDNMAVVHVLNDRKSDVSVLSLARSIKGIMQREWNVKIAHVFRESNQVADFMANLGVNMQPGLVLFDEAPIETMNLLLNDRLGITHGRMCPM